MDWVQRNVKTILSVIIVLSSIGIAIAVLFTHRTDRGFLRRDCMSKSPMDRGQKFGALMWTPPNVPIPVRVTTTAKEWTVPVENAVRRWNLETGIQIFGVPRELSLFEESHVQDPVILVDISNSDGESYEDGETPAHLDFDSGCNLHRVALRMPHLAPKGDREKIALHELGHAIGLDHDDLESSVMYPGGKAIAWGMDEITARDRELLRKTYGGDLK